MIAGQEPAAPALRVVLAVASGTLLNPLNSTMIAVAVVSMEGSFRVSTATASWLISGFYLAAAIGMPLMGRLADLFGPRRIFCAGTLIVAGTSIMAVLAQSFDVVVAARVLQAFGTSAAYPAGLAIFRAGDPRGRPPAAALAVITVTSSVTAALGPALSGLLVGLAGWPTIFLVNIPMAAISLVLALLWLPSRSPQPAGTSRPLLDSLGALIPRLDLLGILLFSATLACLLLFLLSLSSSPLWYFLPVTAVAAASLTLWERRASSAFLDISMLVSNYRLLSIYAQFAAVNVFLYGTTFGLPIWLEEGRGFSPEATGLLVLPVAGVGILSTPLAARVITRFGSGPALVIGSLTLLAGSLLLLLWGPSTPIPFILLAGVVMGIPNGFNNLGLQAALYEHAPADRMGTAAGQFQTFRYVGAIFSIALLGIVFGKTASSSGLHVIAAVLAAIGILLFITALPNRHSSIRE